MYASDPSITHSCGSAQFSYWSAAGCSAGQVVADWLGKLPSSGSGWRLGIGVDESPYAADLTVKYYVNGVLIATQSMVGVSCPTGLSTCFIRTATVLSYTQITDCADVEIQVLAGSNNANFTLDEFDI